MGNPIPSQTRSIDAYSSYNSDVVNKLTRIISNGQDCILEINPVNVEYVSSSSVKTTIGKCIKDDVLVELSSELTIDLTDGDFFVDSTAWNEVGFYYVVLEYEYIKTRPAPIASIQVIRHSERATLYDTDKHLFLACLEIGGAYQVDNIFGYDPDDPSIRRAIAGGVTPINFIDAVTDYYATPEDATIRVSGDTTIYLPLASLCSKEIRVIKKDSYLTTTTVEATGSDLIETQTSIDMTRQWNEITVLPDPDNNVWIEV